MLILQHSHLHQYPPSTTGPFSLITAEATMNYANNSVIQGRRNPAQRVTIDSVRVNPTTVGMVD